MSEVNIRNQIKSIVESASGIGQVHDRVRSVLSDSDFQNIFLNASKVNSWFISLESSEEIPRILGVGSSGANTLIYNYQIEGWYGVSDLNSSEIIFNAIVSDLRGKFRNNITLNNTCFFHERIKIQKLGHDNKFGNLCHYINLLLVVNEIS